VNLAPHFVLGLALPGGDVLLVVFDRVIQGVLELVEARKRKLENIVGSFRSMLNELDSEAS